MANRVDPLLEAIWAQLPKGTSREKAEEVKLAAKIGGIERPEQFARIEHPFRVVKRQFGDAKVRYRGLAKNGAQVLTLFALANLWLARKPLLTATG